MASSSSTLLSSILFFTAIVVTSVSAAEYAVGGEVVGWRLPVYNETELYTVWASRRRFYIGDSLRFRYENDSVVVVEKYGFYHCDSSKPIEYHNDGDTVINLNKGGTMYFISGDGDRCKQGVNMIVKVKNPGPVKNNPPVMPNPPENDPYSAVAPPPVQVLSPGVSPGPSSSDSGVTVSISGSVTAVFVGLGLWGLKV